ncbi:TMV resistance protein N-like [Vigna radiata var. radiata]|uniref:TMV resistance protein N-like n=1 Tax=Vigna radiata var. radiata TaxID=3916 RepID=A0A1S3UA64_VIGRR|nr:TMV resistance protein N-like [Vigna radiata var. radiata]
MCLPLIFFSLSCFSLQIVPFSVFLLHAPLHVADYPVGLPSQVEKVKKLLDVGSDDVVYMIGIHGMGGLGKTTLSLAVYNSIADDFDSSCFLQNVREESNQHGLKHPQSILLSKMLRENIILTSWQEGASMIQERLGRKKVLLILDDVDNRKQLQAFAGRADWFGPGSRVIITTRDEQLLKSHEIKRTYEVEKLNDNDSLQLLIWNAFKREKVDPSYEDVLKRVVTYASGLPLALEVIGSNLVGKSVEEWESAIEHYKRIPNGEILEILKVSYDALGEEEKNVFLDIACFFKGSSLEEVEHILGVLYDNNMKHHIGVLVEKSLIKVQDERFGVIQMHDLIEDMGRDIDRQESPKEPENRMRLWLGKDILHVLKHNKGISKTEIIRLDLSKSEREETLEWNPNAFRRMKSLKILIIRNGKFSKGPNYLPKSLRVLEWHGYPSNCFPSNFDPRNLVTCKLPHSRFTSFGFLGSSKKFENLTVLKFDWCIYLTHAPDMSDLGNLEHVSFQWCENLVAVHDSIGFLSKLKILNARNCKKLMSFPPLNLPTLESLQLSYCSSLEKFPEILGKMGNIMELNLYLPIKELPLSFQNLIGLKKLYLSYEIDHLRSSIVTMPNLIDFRVTNCKRWEWVKSEDAEDNLGSMVPSELDTFAAKSCNLDDDFFAVGFMRLAHVRWLCLSFNNFKHLPECIKEFHNLNQLDVSHCKHLEEIRGFPPKLEYFNATNCISLTPTSLSMLLDKELYEARKPHFRFPGESIPKWFDLKSSGPSCSFWFRNRFPARVLSLLIIHMDIDKFSFVTPEVYINGKCHGSSGTYLLKEERMFEFDQTYLSDLGRLHNLFEQPLEKEWNHVKVTYDESFLNMSRNKVTIKATGIHVFKEENMEDIRFDDPYIREDIIEEEDEKEKEEEKEEEEELNFR